MTGRRWSVEQHPQREEIELELIQGDSFRDVSGRYGISKSALQRYINTRFVNLAAEAMKERQLDHGQAIIERIHNLIKRLEKLVNAADDWLTDPNDPEKYTLHPRADEVEVVYYTYDGEGKPIRHKKKLQELINQIEGTGKETAGLQWKNADIRTLLPRTADSLHRQLDLVAKILGEVKEREAGDTYNFVQILNQAHGERNADKNQK